MDTITQDYLPPGWCIEAGNLVADYLTGCVSVSIQRFGLDEAIAIAWSLQPLLERTAKRTEALQQQLMEQMELAL